MILSVSTGIGVVFKLLRFNRILISISHTTGHADYDTGSDRCIIESSEFFRSARQLYRRNFDGPLLHSPFQTYCVRMLAAKMAMLHIVSGNRITFMTPRFKVLQSVQQNFSLHMAYNIDAVITYYNLLVLPRFSIYGSFFSLIK